MPAAARDYRAFAFDLVLVDSSAKSVARDPYRKLYAAENILRVVVSSVLIAQLGPDWWAIAASPTLQQETARRRLRHQKRPWHGSPGSHPIYFTLLSELSALMQNNKNLFQPAVPDIDAWISRIDQVLIPRNIVGHMNWPSSTDRNRISVFHDDLKALAKHLQTVGVGLVIP